MKKSLFNYGHLQHREELKLQLLINLRWVLLLMMTILLCVLMLLYKIDRFTFFYLCLIFVGVGVFNTYSISKIKSADKVSTWDIFFSLAFDLIIVSICILLCGGITTPFSAFIFIYVILGGLLLDIKKSLLILGFSLACLLFLWLAPLPILINHRINYSEFSYLLGSSVVLFILWPLITWVQKSFSVLDRNLMQVSKQLQQADRLKAFGLLSAGLSHELATPLNTILLKSNRIKKKSGDEFKEDIELLSEATNSCLNSLKRIQQISAGSDELSFEEFNLIDSVRSLIHFKGWRIPIETEVEEFFFSLPLIGFLQIMVDLLENAIEASGEESTHIEISGSKQRLSLKIINMDAQVDRVVLDHLGEPFVTTKDQGTGLGLYNAKVFLESIGAKFSIANIDSGVCAEIEFGEGVIL